MFFFAFLRALSGLTTMAGKWQEYGQAAEQLFLSGKTIDEIAAILPVSRKSIGEWSRTHNWVTKRKVRATSAAEISEFTLDVLHKKLADLRELPADQIDAGAIDGIYKLLITAERVAKETRLLEKAVLVMDAYIDHCQKDLPPEELEQEFARINTFLSALEQH